MHTRNSSKYNNNMKVLPKTDSTAPVPMYGIIRHNPDSKVTIDTSECEGPIDLSIGKRRTEHEDVG